MVGMIPWVTILKHAPTILAAADALLARVRANNAGDGRCRWCIRIRSGTMRRQARGWAITANTIAVMLSTVMFLIGALITS